LNISGVCIQQKRFFTAPAKAVLFSSNRLLILLSHASKRFSPDFIMGFRVDPQFPDYIPSTRRSELHPL
jgi:hypothetical protein